MTHCPCCAHQLLRHIHQRQVYWFCRHCWQEMPALQQDIPSATMVSLEAEFSRSLSQRSLIDHLV